MSTLEDDVEIIRKEDIENHCLDGGLWVIIKGQVYDLQEVQTQVQLKS